MIWFFNFISRWTVMIPGKKILLYFTPWNKVTLFHGKILKPISDVKFINIANLSISNFCGIWKFLIWKLFEGVQYFNPMGTGGLFHPRVIKMLAISKPMIQLLWFFLTFPQLMHTKGLSKNICTLVIILCYFILFYEVSRYRANAMVSGVRRIHFKH